MAIKFVSTVLERWLGIALSKRESGLGRLHPVIEEIVAEPWFDPDNTEERKRYAAERFAHADMHDSQKRSLLIITARRYYSRS